MKIIIPGGTGHIGSALEKHLRQQGHEVIILSRSKRKLENFFYWDGETLGEWAQQIDGADIIINLAGRTVNCRYTEENLKQMMDSRVLSTKVIGEAIQQSKKPPALWLQMSTATIYAHRFDEANDEFTGQIGGNEKNVPAYWARSIQIAQSWEKSFFDSKLVSTRKVALRTAMVMGSHPESVFAVLSKMVKFRLGGSIAGGRQFVSWLHEKDFFKAIDFIITHSEIEGCVNLASPNPLPQKEFMKILRNAWKITLGLPAAAWMAEIGAFLLRTDTELLLKSRRVVPTKLVQAGFDFEFKTWPEAAHDLVKASLK